VAGQQEFLEFVECRGGFKRRRGVYLDPIAGGKNDGFIAMACCRNVWRAAGMRVSAKANRSRTVTGAER